ncbi:hypothetical protein B484DRAFT_468756, partial [Ochromonadaceae sp. CCMP2298]
MRPSVLLGRRNMQSSPPPPGMAHTASLHVHQQYDVLFEGIVGIDETERGGGGRTEKDIYVSNVVGDYLDSVMPEESLQKHSTLTWVQSFFILIKYHEYTSMFFGRSLNQPRLMRYTHVVLSLLLLIFFDSLFFGVFYPDEGICEGLLSAEACLAEDSRVSSAKLCLWTADSSYAGGGQCTLNQPPEDFIFICLVVLVTVTFCVPLIFCYDLLLFNVCFRRPHLSEWGWSTEEAEEYLGRTTQKYFILEQFSFLKQFALKKHLFDYAASSPLPVSPWAWLLAWAWVVLTHAFCLYWALLWTVSQGGVTVQAWGINLAFGLLQDLFIVHAFRVYLIYMLTMVSIKPQLKYIYRVLNKVAISYAQDEQEAPGSVSAPVVVQYTSPACRAARLQIAADLATGNILRYMDDVDVEMCSIEYSMRMSLLAVAMLAIPITVSILSESLGDLLLETIFPPFFTSLLMCNYYVYSAIGWLLDRELDLVPAEAGKRPWRRGWRREEETQASAALALPSKVLAMRAAVSSLSRQWRTEQQLEQEQEQEQGQERGGQGRYLTRLMSRSSSLQNQAEQAHVQAVLPAFPAQAGASDYSLDHGLYLERSSFPHILEQKGRLAQIRHLRATDHAPVQSSRQTDAYRHLYEVTTDPQEAVDRLLRSYKERVLAGEMQLLDAADWGQLCGRANLRSANVLVDFAQLGELLRELFVYYRPGARKVYRTQSSRNMDMPASISGKMQSPAGVSGKMQSPAGVSGKMQSPAGVSGKMQLPAGVSGKM